MGMGTREPKKILETNLISSMSSGKLRLKLLKVSTINILVKWTMKSFPTQLCCPCENGHQAYLWKLIFSYLLGSNSSGYGNHLGFICISYLHNFTFPPLGMKYLVFPSVMKWSSVETRKSRSATGGYIRNTSLMKFVVKVSLPSLL